MADLQNDKTVVTRLKIRSSGFDPVTAQHRVAGLLNAVSLQPAGLSASAILIVRHLRDPRPGTLPLHYRDVRPPATWEQALQAEIDQLARAAARPIADAVPANAQAVVFADRAEWLACLAADWLDGALTTHWWWRALARQFAASRAVIPIWLETPESIPGALAHLVAMSHGVPFVRVLTPAEILSMITAVVRVFGLSDLHAVLRRSLVDYPLEQAIDRAPPQSSTGEDSFAIAADTPELMPFWCSHVPDVAWPELRPAQQLLLGVSLMLERTPATVRSAACARQVAQWLTAQSTGQTEAEFAQPASAQSAADSPITVAHSPAAQLMARETRLVTGRAAAGKSDEPNSSQAEAPATQGSVLEHERAQPNSITSLERSANQAPARSPSEINEPIEEIATRFGGLFYLVNVGLHLNLYADFSQPLMPGLDLPIWDFVALVGRRLLGDALVDDAVWNLLARLAQRANDEPPGLHFTAPDEWRMPIEWLAAFSARESWAWSAADNRLRIFHPAGFTVVDVERTTVAVSEQLHAELQIYTDIAGPLSERSRSDRAATTQRLERWLNWLLPYLQGRLGLALGAADPRDLVRFFEQRGRINLSATRLDISLALNDLPIEIRLAGLDRDPGWVPAAGRYIAFHFA